ncbi:MAG: IS481 family transposase [candidate division NC10 bacterium]
MPWKTLTKMNQRSEFVMRAQMTDNFRALCREYGISPRVGYKWQKRFLALGLEGLREGSRRPRSSPGGLDEETVCRVVRFRERHPGWGARKLQELYRRGHGEPPSESSIKRVLERCGMVRKRRVRTVGEQGRIASGRKAQRPNEVWTIDFKGWWKDAYGRCEPLTVRDEHSRYVLEVRAMANGRTESVRECVERLFRRYGLPGAIRSDNGTPFASTQSLLGLSRLSVWWLALGIDLERGRPGCPQDNGGHERLHLDISRQLQGVGYEERQAAFDLWRQEFNEERPHEALGMKMPGEVYRNSERRYEGTPEQLEYPGIETRRVGRSGCIRYRSDLYFLSTALRGWDVGLKPQADSLFEVHFAGLVLGRIEPSTVSFLPVLPVANATAEGENKTIPQPQIRRPAVGLRSGASPLGFASQANRLHSAQPQPHLPLDNPTPTLK